MGLGGCTNPYCSATTSISVIRELTEFIVGDRLVEASSHFYGSVPYCLHPIFFGGNNCSRGLLYTDVLLRSSEELF